MECCQRGTNRSSQGLVLRSSRRRTKILRKRLTNTSVREMQSIAAAKICVGTLLSSVRVIRESNVEWLFASVTLVRFSYDSAAAPPSEIARTSGARQRQHVRLGKSHVRAGYCLGEPAAWLSLSRWSISSRSEFSSSSLGSPPAPPLVARIIPARSMTTICGMFKISFPVRPR
jgi:hypothetical protein